MAEHILNALAALAAQPAASAEPSDDVAELISLLRDIRPKYGDVGTRDVDVAARQQRIDRAIALLSRYGRPAGDAQPIRLEHMAVADEDGLRWMSGRKMPTGVESVELYAVSGYGKAPNVVYAAPVAAQKAAELAECRSAVAEVERLRKALAALRRAWRTAMEQTIKARIPECAEFAGIAQDLDFVVAALEQENDDV